MGKPGVSVLLTTYNGAKFIRKQLDSILAQTVLPQEIIVCDDRSADETLMILKAYADEGKIKLFTNDVNIGVVGNLKRAAALAGHKWLLFADQDDIWIPQKVQRLTEEMLLIDDDKTPALVYTDLVVIDKNDAIVSPSFWERQRIRPEKIKLATLLYGNVVTGCTMIINAPMAEEFSKMESGSSLHDEWLALIAYSFGKVKYLREKLVLYRQHESNITFSESYKVPSIKAGLTNAFGYLFKNKNFLPHQFELAKGFLSRYRAALTEKQVGVVARFIKEENKNYILQRINRWITYL